MIMGHSYNLLHFPSEYCNGFYGNNLDAKKLKQGWDIELDGQVFFSWDNSAVLEGHHGSY